jgi:hypothetical protein
MIIPVSEAMDVPLHQRNELLLAAGFARSIPDSCYRSHIGNRDHVASVMMRRFRREIYEPSMESRTSS